MERIPIQSCRDNGLFSVIKLAANYFVSSRSFIKSNCFDLCSKSSTAMEQLMKMKQQNPLEQNFRQMSIVEDQG
jgi:hypothetical protein